MAHDRTKIQMRSRKWEVARKKAGSFMLLSLVLAGRSRTNGPQLQYWKHRQTHTILDGARFPPKAVLRSSGGAIVLRRLLSRQRLPFAALMIQACLLQLAGAQLSEQILCPQDHISEVCNGGIDPQ